MRQFVAFGIAMMFAFAVSAADLQAQCCGNSGVAYATPMTYGAPVGYSSYGYAPQACNQCCTVRRGLFGRTVTRCSTCPSTACCATAQPTYAAQTYAAQTYAVQPVAYTSTTGCNTCSTGSCAPCTTCCTTRPTLFPRRTATYCSTCCTPCQTGCAQPMYGTTVSGCAGCAGGSVMMSPTIQGVPAQGTIVQPQTIQQGTVSPPTPDDT